MAHKSPGETRRSNQEDSFRTFQGEAGDPLEVCLRLGVKDYMPYPGVGQAVDLGNHSILISVKELQVHMANPVPTLGTYDVRQLGFSDWGNGIPGEFCLSDRSIMDHVNVVKRYAPHVGKGRRDKAQFKSHFVHDGIHFSSHVAPEAGIHFLVNSPRLKGKKSACQGPNALTGHFRL
jgi:hypothetical protein